MSKERKQTFITRATEIAWSLVTAVPPLVPSCDDQVFSENLHEKSSWDDKCSSSYKLKYSRPVLYSRSLGVVTQKGCVRNAKVDEGKALLSTTFIHVEISLKYYWLILFDTMQLLSLHQLSLQLLKM